MKKYRYDTHVHTDEVSVCGKIAAEKLVEMYHGAGYDGVVITDHFYSGFFNGLGDISRAGKIESFLSGYKKAKEAAEKYDMDVLLGAEMRFDELPNDYLVFGITEEMLFNEDFLTPTLKEFQAIKEKYGLLIYQAHPFRRDMTPRKKGLIDGIEVYNGNPRHNSQNKTAVFYAKEHGLKALSGSDFHQTEDLARGGILAPKRFKTSCELRDYLKENEPELIFDKNSI